MKVDFNIEPNKLEIPEFSEDIINFIAETVGQLYDLNNAEVGITLTNNEYIHKINKEFRHIDRPTDVISFALNDMSDEEPEIIGENESRELLGDIIISIDKAKEQATEYGHSLKRELSFLTVHGLLHLLGYDHMNTDDEQEMIAEQNFIMDKLKINR